MESIFQANALDLLANIQPCTQLATSKNAIAILSCLRIKSNDEGELEIVASDGENSVTTNVFLVEKSSGFDFCVNATDFQKTIASLKDKGVLSFYLDGKKGVVIKHGTGSMRLATQDAKDYPSIELRGGEKKKFAVGRNDLLNAINACIASTSNDELRMVLNGVHFDFEGNKMVSVATSGYQLTKCSFVAQNAINEPFGFTLPKTPCKLLKSILATNTADTIQIAYVDGQVLMSGFKFSLTSRLLEGKYPNYNSVIPQNEAIKVHVDKSMFIDSVKRAVLLSNKTSELLRFTFADGKIEIEGEDIDFGNRAVDSVPCDIEGNNLTIGFKGSIMLSVLETTPSDKVTICLQDESHAGKVVPFGNDNDFEYLAILMPMQLNN